ncbi:MAG: hypothetical protein CSA97_04970 [Bacteroidetes bacterium]|nr:MAG: hypothetical protein CSA97_04970 [Bacteroidota bacterium]
MMKRFARPVLLASAVLLLSATGTFAQFRFGGHVGLAGSWLNTEVKLNDRWLTPEKTTGGFAFNFGGDALYAFKLNPILLEVQSGLEVRRIATKIEQTWLSNAILSSNTTIKFSAWALTIPLRANVAFPLGPFSLLGGLGMGMDIFLAGKEKITTTASSSLAGVGTGGEEEVKVKFDGKESKDRDAGDEDVHMNRLNFSLDFHLGAEFIEHLRAELYFKLGLRNLVPDDNGKAKFNEFGVRVGYLF